MKLFIYGAGGAGIEIYDLSKRVNASEQKYSDVYLIDDFAEEKNYCGTIRMHFSSCKKYMENDDAEFVITVGEPEARKYLMDKVEREGYRLGKLIDPSVLICDNVIIEDGCIINAGSIISSSAILKKNCMLGYHTIVGHNAILEEGCVVSPMSTIGGNSTVGQNSFVGLNVSMKEGVSIGKNVIVGMGSMLFKDVPDNCTVIGNPARITKGNDNHKVF